MKSSSKKLWGKNKKRYWKGLERTNSGFHSLACVYLQMNILYLLSNIS